MKSNIYIHCLLLVVFLFIAGNIQANTHSADQDRAYIASKIKFVYVPYPNSKNPTTETLDNHNIQAGKTTEKFWEDTYNPGAHNLVKALLLSPSNGGDQQLQYMVTRILKIRDKPVLIYLLNDHNLELLPKVADVFGGSVKDGKAWASGNNMEKLDAFSKAMVKCEGAASKAVPLAFAGYMTLGTTYLNENQTSKTYTSFVHELGHTQDRHVKSDLSFYIGNESFIYGKDGSHWISEIIPSRAHAYHEGLANAFSYLYRHQRFNAQYDWFKDNGALRVELVYVDRNAQPSADAVCMGATRPSQNIWIYEEIKNQNISESQSRKSYSNPATDYAFFSLQDLPPQYLVHNETIIALTVYSYVKLTNFSRFSYIVSSANEQIARRQHDAPLSELLDAMGRSHLNKGESLDDIFFHQAKPTTPQKYMLPLALIDYYTGYNAKNQDDLIKMAGYHANMQKWLILYWPHRETIRKGINLEKLAFSDVDIIAENVGVKLGQ